MDVDLTTTGPGNAQGRKQLAGATVGMAVGTTLSRITGVGRIFALTYALGGGSVADAYNLANTTPNIIHDIVLGGILGATFVPVFVDRLTTRRQSEAWRAISAVTTVTMALLAVASVAFWFLTPAIVGVYTVANHAPDVVQQRRLAVELLRWFVPQLAGYGIIGLFTALLNARRKFAVPMFVAIANNAVVIVVLFWFHALVPHPTLASVASQHGHLVFLAVGTTLGVILQAVLLLPSLKRADIHLRFRWEPGHEAMRTILRLASWTFGLVVANQVALVVVLALADGVRPQGAVSAYTYAFTFFQLPFGVVAVSVMSIVTPALSARWALRDTVGFRRRLAFGLRGMLAIIVPSAVGMLILAHPLINLVLHHGHESVTSADNTGAALAMFSLGLPGFCTYLYMIRVLQAMQDTRTAFYLYLVENGINVVAGISLVGPLGVRGLALSVSIAYSITAVIALWVIRHRVGGLGGDALTRPLRRVVLASLVMGIVTVVAVNVSSAPAGIGLLARVALAILLGAAAYVGTAGVLGARAARTARRERGALRAANASRQVSAFRDRLGDESIDRPFRHLRPVENWSGDDKGEDLDGPGPGGDR